jgi:hypothetical protein
MDIVGKFHRSRVNDRAIFGNESDSSAAMRGIGQQRADGSGSNKCFSDLVVHLVVQHMAFGNSYFAM